MWMLPCSGGAEERVDTSEGSEGPGGQLGTVAMGLRRGAPLGSPTRGSLVTRVGPG